MVTSDSYVVGALVLGHSLRRAGTTRRLVCMVTPCLAYDSVASLREVWEIRTVAPLDSGDIRSLQLLGRPELGPTFTKIRLWTLTEFRKVVFLDADILVLRSIDDLFEREEFSACADVGWPDCFNSGLFVCRPSLETFAELMSLAMNQGSFDGGDQGLLNTFFANWSTGPGDRRIPFTYNLTFNACYSYAPAFAKYKDQVRAVHFIGTTKPWNFTRFSDGQVAPRGDGATVHMEYVQMWWDLHDEFVKPKVKLIFLSEARAALILVVSRPMDLIRRPSWVFTMDRYSRIAMIIIHLYVYVCCCRDTILLVGTRLLEWRDHSPVTLTAETVTLPIIASNGQPT